MPLDIDQSPDFFVVDDYIRSDTNEVIVLNSENDPDRNISLESSIPLNTYNYSIPIRNFSSYVTGYYMLSGTYTPSPMVCSG